MKPVLNGTSFTSKFAKNVATDKKSFTPIPSGFFSVKHGRSIQEEEKPKVAFGKTTASPDILCKVEEKYEFGGIKKKAGRKAEIYAKQKTYIPIVLDFLECKIKKRLHDDEQKKRNISIDQSTINNNEEETPALTLDIRSPSVIDRALKFDHIRYLMQTS